MSKYILANMNRLEFTKLFASQDLISCHSCLQNRFETLDDAWYQ